MHLCSSFTFNTDNQKLNQMVQASLESIAYRQDKFNTGGIVESDDRFNNGFLYGDGTCCYPRVWLVRSLITMGQIERAEKFCRFWLKAQLENGQFQRCHRVDDPNLTFFARDLKETDTNGYVLKHWGEYIEATNDFQFLEDCIPGVIKLVDILEGFYNPEFQMCEGAEEVILKNPEGETGNDGQPHIPGFNLQINTAVMDGLYYASNMLKKADKTLLAAKALKLSENIRQGIQKHLWNEKEQRYLFGIGPEGNPYLGDMWFSLLFAYCQEKWNAFADKTFWYLWDKFYDKDPLIPHSYWSNDFSLLMKGKCSRHSRYTGAGPFIGVSPAICQMLMMSGRMDLAGEQLKLILDYTDDSNLIPEHINTLSTGQEGSFKIYPEIPCRVDRGNLMHMTFFLNLIRFMSGVRRDGILAPMLPEGLKTLDVSNLNFNGQLIGFSLRVDHKNNKGKTTLELSLQEHLDNPVAVQSGCSVKKVTMNGIEQNNFRILNLYSGESDIVVIDHLEGNNVKIEVDWVR